MQIDGHHTLTYVLSRMAGFEHDEAYIIAHSAQYVDDATNAVRRTAKMSRKVLDLEVTFEF